MDNNQNTNVNNEPLQPTNGVGQEPIQPTTTPTDDANQSAVAPTGDATQPVEEKKAVQTRIIEDTKSKPQINLAAYAKANEKREKEEKVFTEDPHAGLKRFFGFLTVILIIIFALFLPNISMKVDEYIKSRNLKNITTGTLKCAMTKDTDTLRIEYEQDFRFNENRILDYKYRELSTGTREDSKELSDIIQKCKKLDQSVSGEHGITITCSSTATNASVIQEIDLDSIDVDKLLSGFSEAGGVFPDFRAGDSVDDVQSKLLSLDYTCEKVG